ncbi:hypothetical protein PG994_009100 [Apiospora phragmitis]|uniref:Uncharacterized protein n=1 Tax=Apiospora phragmitis TaxID=2905665 RepID=A0ABR1UIC0_9PEZI
MGGFGTSVSALLDTYTRCLGLLKAFKGHDGSNDTSPYDPAVSKAHARLRGSIRSDRSQIRKAYSSKFSKRGNRLQRGDAPSKAAIRQILDKLKAAITNLLSMVKTQKPVLDYESLMSLSNTSRIDAIRTMEQLSLRLSSSSSLFHEHRRPISGSSSSSNSSRRRRKKARRQPSRDTDSDVSGERSRSRRHTVVASSDDGTKGKTRRQKSLRKASQDFGTHHSKHSRSRSNRSNREDLEERYDQHRISYMTVSSDSTKLGEIAHRRSRIVNSSDSSQGDGYNVRPVYPLHTYMPPAPKEKRGFLRRVFGGKTRQDY